LVRSSTFNNFIDYISNKVMMWHFVNVMASLLLLKNYTESSPKKKKKKKKIT